MDSDKRQELRKQAHDLDVTVWVGKSGVDNVVDELQEQLKVSNLVKVKFLRSARSGKDVEEVATELEDKADAQLVETRGNTAVYYK
ncbi:MAG: YhbY family RNA-binding protein [Halobacteria archaeon]|nr:YhbY family RNA-binding protein [Halobacteria archaeon]